MRVRNSTCFQSNLKHCSWEYQVASVEAVVAPIGFSRFLTLCRNLTSGTWPVRKIRVLCQRVSFSLVLQKLESGNCKSIFENSSKRGEPFHLTFHFALSLLWNSCLTADAFRGRGYRRRCIIINSRQCYLNPPFPWIHVIL